MGLQRDGESRCLTPIDSKMAGSISILGPVGDIGHMGDGPREEIFWKS